VSDSVHAHVSLQYNRTDLTKVWYILGLVSRLFSRDLKCAYHPEHYLRSVGTALHPAFLRRISLGVPQVTVAQILRKNSKYPSQDHGIFFTSATGHVEVISVRYQLSLWLVILYIIALKQMDLPDSNLPVTELCSPLTTSSGP
jgi:hypothetical protein